MHDFEAVLGTLKPSTSSKRRASARNRASPGGAAGTSAGAPVSELARVMRTSIEMIERHYGTLLDGSAAGFAERMDAYESDTG